MAWCRMCGKGEPPVQFPWNAYNETWTSKNISIAGQDSSEMRCVALSPKIISGCYVSARLTGDTYNLTYQVQVSTNGTTWTTIDTISGTANPTFTTSLASYVNSQIYIRFAVSNLTGTTKNCTLNACTINV